MTPSGNTVKPETGVLMLSSFVSAGHVGLSAASPALQRLGVRTTLLPTVVLSNQLGVAHVAGEAMPIEMLNAMIEALAGNGWLSGHRALLLGYMPDAAHVEVAVDLVARFRDAAPQARVIVDPIMGDNPGGLYIPLEAAQAVREKLVPLADALTPNRFELGWLTGAPAATLAEAAAAARQLREISGGADVHVTSAPVSTDRTGVLSLDATGTHLVSAPLRQSVPNGVGDVFAAFTAAGLRPGAALGHLQVLVDASLGGPHLRIAEAAHLWSAAPPLESHPFDEG